MKNTILYLVILLICSHSVLLAQMLQADSTIRYGNEWIDYEQRYVKINLAEDGIYRLNQAELSAAGVFDDANVPNGAQLQLFHMGEEVPMYVSTTGSLTASDFVEFYGKKTDGELDKHLYVQPEFQLNPAQSLFVDTSSYYLTWREIDAEQRFQSVNNNISAAPQKETTCIEQLDFVFNERYSDGEAASSESIACRYTNIEGYGNALSAEQTFSFDTPHAVRTSTNADINIRLYTSSGEHNLQVMLNNDNLTNDAYSGWEIKNYDLDVPNNRFATGENTVRVLANGTEFDRAALVSASVRYTRDFSFDGEEYFEFELENANRRQYLEFEGFNHAGVAPILYDLTNNLRIATSLQNNVVKALLPTGNTSTRKCVLLANTAIKRAAKVERRDFQKFDFENEKYNYILLTHSRLFDDGNGVNHVQEYADYRASQEGGAYTPIIVDVNQIYDQFGYGIERHELAIRNFLRLAATHWETEQLFILAKGIDKVKMRNTPEDWGEYSLVPPFGYPHSDYLFVMSNEDAIPWMGVGRIAAYRPAQVKLYLDKVKEFEGARVNNPQTIEDKAWQKRVIHFGGGDINIQDFIREELNSIKDTISTGQYGADVVSFFKNSTDVLQDAPADEVEEYIESGASMLTFFGHSAPTTLDFNIANPSVYQNKGKYPIFYAIGCNTNRVFDVVSTLSEDYVLIKDQGAIAFFGATWVTQLGSLSRYARFLYGNLADDYYGEPIGTVIKETIDDFTLPSSSFSQELVKQCLMLHGDPALRIYPHAAPDYLVNVQKSKVAPEVINLRTDSFNLDLTITNIGKSIQDSITLRLEHVLTNGNRIFLQNMRIPAPTFESDYNLTLPLLEKRGAIGRNQIVVTVDVENDVDELPAVAAESNNTSSIPFFAISDEAKPVYPPEFAIVRKRNIKLQASTTNAFAEAIQYFMEIDTTTKFNSPIKQSAVIEQTGGIVAWQPNVNWQEDETYYWRISADSTTTNGQGFIWNNSSFTYLPNELSEGWNQGHHFQYLADDLKVLSIDSMTRVWEFGEFTKNVRIRFSVFGNNVDPGGLGLLEVALFENGFRQFSGFPCPSPNRRLEQIIMAEYNPVTLERDIIIPQMGATPNCKNKDINWYIFHLHSTEERAKFIETIQNVESGRYVALFTTTILNSTYYADQWAADSTALGTNIFEVLETEGARQIRAVEENQTPYIFIFKKDDPSFLPIERHASTQTDVIEASADFTGISPIGYIKSPAIGPAASWGSVSWKLTDIDRSDKASLNIYGVTQYGAEVLLNEGVLARDTILDRIDATQFPYLKLEMVLEDQSSTPTPPELEYWRVLYEPTYDLALAPNQQFFFHADTLQQGDQVRMELAVANLGAAASDSLMMQYTIVDAQNNELKYIERNRPLESKGSLIAQFDFDTKPIVGENQLIIEMSSEGERKELNLFNNVGVKQFVVLADKRNPLLDVTFDGVRIMNGDIVSPTPEIMVYVRDENKFLALNDTALIELKLIYPSGESEMVRFDDPDVTFYPPSEAELESRNEARISLQREFLENGTYQLQVQAEDKTGNDAGEFMYTVEFEIVRENKVSNVLNYPNPFSTSTQFVFTLTGEEVPQDLKIQIMTVSGQVIREIDMAELGNVRIGRNISEFRWDGTDQFGDKLANGVYLYRVMIRSNDGEDYEKFDPDPRVDTDKYFQQNIGKMVILR